MPKGTKTPTTPKKEAAWEDSNLTAVVQSQAHFLVLQLSADGKFEAQTGIHANKRNLSRVIGGMAL